MPVVQVIKTGIANPYVRKAATDLAINLVNEVGVPLIECGVNKAYRKITRKRHRKHRRHN